MTDEELSKICEDYCKWKSSADKTAIEDFLSWLKIQYTVVSIKEICNKYRYIDKQIKEFGSFDCPFQRGKKSMLEDLFPHEILSNVYKI